jgi:hypothetical protein
VTAKTKLDDRPSHDVRRPELTLRRERIHVLKRCQILLLRKLDGCGARSLSTPVGEGIALTLDLSELLG